MIAFATGLLLGLASSIHCAGMCGPILLTVNKFGRLADDGRAARMLAYHAARVFVYVMLGLAAGYTGMFLATAALGRAIATLSGVLLISAAIGTVTAPRVKRLPAVWSRIVVRGCVVATRLISTRPLSGYVVLGLANGLLPCGLLYAALASAVALGTVGRSVLFMSGFGVGTLPILLGIAVSVVSLPGSWKQRIQFAGPVVMAIAGTLLIARGIVPVDRAADAHVSHSILSLQR
jgi:sulfite exporter TauE/SafE